MSHVPWIPISALWLLAITASQSDVSNIIPWISGSFKAVERDVNVKQKWNKSKSSSTLNELSISSNLKCPL